MIIAVGSTIPPTPQYKYIVYKPKTARHIDHIVGIIIMLRWSYRAGWNFTTHEALAWNQTDQVTFRV